MFYTQQDTIPPNTHNTINRGHKLCAPKPLFPPSATPLVSTQKILPVDTSTLLHRPPMTALAQNCPGQYA